MPPGRIGSSRAAGRCVRHPAPAAVLRLCGNNGAARRFGASTIEGARMGTNERETGARKLQPIPPRDETDQNAALPKKPGASGTKAPGSDAPEDPGGLPPDRR
jgi:hypothetical protein